jgi:hypothetical protein
MSAMIVGKAAAPKDGSESKALHGGLQHGVVGDVSHIKVGKIVVAGRQREDRHCKCSGDDQRGSMSAAQMSDRHPTTREARLHRQDPCFQPCCSGKSLPGFLPIPEILSLSVHRRLTTTSVQSYLSP